MKYLTQENHYFRNALEKVKKLLRTPKSPGFCQEYFISATFFCIICEESFLDTLETLAVS